MLRFTLSVTALFLLASCGNEAVNTEDAANGTGPVADQQVADQQVANQEGEKEGCGGDCEGCEGEHEGGEHGDHEHADGEICTGDCGGEGGDDADPLVAGSQGKGITMTEFTPISAILAAPEEFVGKRVLVQGVALNACEHRGCWVELNGDEPSQKLRVKVKDGEIVFPMSCVGKNVVAEGVWDKIVYTVETLREHYAKQAEAKGEEFDPASITEPRIVWQLRGLGARIDS